MALWAMFAWKARHGLQKQPLLGSPQEFVGFLSGVLEFMMLTPIACLPSLFQP